MLRIVGCLLICLAIVSDRPPVNTVVRHVPPSVTVDPCAALPTQEQYLRLASTDPLAMLRASIARARQEVRGYTVTLVKRERLGGRLNPQEVIHASYRVNPHSVLLEWKSEPTGQAERVLYVEGANGDQMLVRPKSRLARAVAGAVVTIDPEGKEARAGGRVSIRDFGMEKAAERLLAAWTAASNSGMLHVECRGVQPVPELDGRPCVILERLLQEPDDDGLHRVVVGFDVETWMHVMTVMTDAKGQLIASYFFRSVALNPELPDAVFDRASLK
jgi:hypothetical protein